MSEFKLSFELAVQLQPTARLSFELHVQLSFNLAAPIERLAAVSRTGVRNPGVPKSLRSHGGNLPNTRFLCPTQEVLIFDENTGVVNDFGERKDIYSAFSSPLHTPQPHPKVVNKHHY